VLALTLFCAYVSVATGFYTLLTRTAVEYKEDVASTPWIYAVEGGGESAERKTA
jgi:hypothetical protein